MDFQENNEHLDNNKSHQEVTVDKIVTSTSAC